MVSRPFKRVLHLLFTAYNQETNLEAFTLEGFAELVVLEPKDSLHGSISSHDSK